MSNHKNNGPFISVIKVKGIHLLPPVITQKKRAELQGYKQQAIKLEKRLKNCRDLKRNLEDLLNMQALTERPYSEISFRDNSHIEALGIAEKNRDHISPINRSFKNVQLSQDIIDVTQYNNEGIKILYNDKNCVTSYQEHHLTPYSSAANSDTNTSLIKQNQIGPLLQPTNNQNNSTEGCNFDVTILNGESPNNNSLENNCTQNISSTLEKSSRPRLIRSNSYTLETPSPILLAHLEKTEKSNKDIKVQNIENVSISRNWSSLENNYMPFENSNFSSINTVYNTNADHFSREKIQSSTPQYIEEEKTIYNTNCNHSSSEKIQTSTPNHNEEDKLETSTSPAIKVIQTDISVQNITVSANNEILNDALNENCETSDSQLLQVLKALPDIYAKQIVELIESQKNKQKLISHNEKLDENINKANEQMPNRDDEIIKGDNIMSNRTEDLLNSALNNLENDCQVHQSLSFSGSDKLRGSTTSISPSQSVYYSVTSSDTIRPLSNCSVRLFDFECDDAAISDQKSESPQKTINAGYSVHEEIRKRMDVSRRLFPELNINASNTLKQEWAASIIGAHARGYLTRRLLKTERVQSLIETIKDALMCALQLHNAENIDESDVELHRRLINQVSAACYTFHDIFFALTVQEQMVIIATDRQRRLEKAKRPSSAPSGRRSKSSSTRSTPRQQRVPSHSRSLTKV